MPPARQEESREWLLLPESLTDEALCERRRQRMRWLVVLAGAWLLTGLLSLIELGLGAGCAVITVTVLLIWLGMHWGSRVQTPWAQQQVARMRTAGIVIAPFSFFAMFLWHPYFGLACPVLVAALPVLLGIELGRERFVASGRLRGVDLCRRSLNKLDLHNGDLKGAQLSGSSLRQAIFDHADLSDAVFSQADLRGARFLRARLVGARFTDADLSGAELRQADLSEAQLVRARLSGATYDIWTQWPAGFDPEARGAVKVD